MPRHDLLALTVPDLETLSNRGTVKRATKELDRGSVSVELSEVDDSVLAHWSDGVAVRIDAGETVANGHCDCAASGVCRHIIRTVLAYQHKHAGGESGETTDPADGQTHTTSVGAPWDPGTIGDDALTPHFAKARFTTIRRVWQSGCLVELTRSAKPVARFLSLPATVVFQVPGDPRYTACTCEDEAPCRHVPLAIWAFRELETSEERGVVEAAPDDPADLGEVLGLIDQIVREVVEFGLAAASAGTIKGLDQVAARCRAMGLIWPAEILDELAREWLWQREGDARFSPEVAASLVGELIIRRDAIESSPDGVSQIFVRGSANDREMRLSGSRFMGLGTDVVAHRNHVQVSAWMQDLATGEVVSLMRRFEDPTDGSAPPSYATLGAKRQSSKVPGLATIGAGQLLTKGGRLTPGREMRLGRTPASVTPSSHDWAGLRDRTRAESFSDVRERLSRLLPPALRARRVGADFFVVPVTDVPAVHFDPVRQCLLATLSDSAGHSCILRQPYDKRAAGGFETLLVSLESPPAWVAGRFRQSGNELYLAPTALVWPDGSMVQPWVDVGPEAARQADSFKEGVRDPIKHLISELRSASAALCLGGLLRSDYLQATELSELAELGASLGSTRLAAIVESLAYELETKQRSTRWSSESAVESLVDLLALIELAKGVTH